MLYKNYLKLFKKNKIITGFSQRLPDYANEHWLNQLSKIIKKTAKKSFLDIGAGSGRLSILLANSGFDKGTSVEIQVDKKRWNGILNEHKNLELVEGLLQEKIEELENKEKYNFILMSEVFEHIPPKDVSCFLSSLKKVLDDDGKIFLTTPNAIVCGSAEKASNWYKIQPYGHYKHYTVEEVKAILLNHGFDVESYGFECNKIKRKFYNKVFYPVSRWDARFLYSKKLPCFIKKIYSIVSFPVALCMRAMFWVAAKCVTMIEEKYNNENNATTMMLLVKHKK
jgi:2-polyprenyl-3-methyl-5-hydroxy-6-metoxy-1,4-benzoquinol methylase